MISRTSVRDRVERIVIPLRDVFAAIFFIAFGLSIDVGAIGSVAVPVLIAIAITVFTNVTAGLVTARLFGLNQRGAANVGLTVLGRGEYSLILATLALGAGLDDRIGPFIALYVLILAVVAPILASNSQVLARMIPDRLLYNRWRYVREETISTACTHMDQIQITETDVDECVECVELGDTWVQLRMCLSCGAVGCCNDSQNKHADQHFRDTGHPIIRSLQEGDGWQYCYLDQTLIREPAGSAKAS